jgi:phosphate transport system ATP-binding protein
MSERTTEAAGATIETHGASLYYGSYRAVKDISVRFAPRMATAIIGPSGCGKSTLLRTLNRINNRVPSFRVEGQITLDGVDVYAPNTDLADLRRRVGMVFQKPNPFPQSIFANVAFGLTLYDRVPRGELEEQIERALRAAALWDEVKDKLGQSALALSGGQQQRLCIARAIATRPEVLLMDEPASALDPISTLKIEELMLALEQDFTIVIVTHNMQQAARVADYTVFLSMEPETRAGFVVEAGPTEQLFTNPRDSRTEAYISGRFG